MPKIAIHPPGWTEIEDNLLKYSILTDHSVPFLVKHSVYSKTGKQPFSENGHFKYSKHRYYNLSELCPDVVNCNIINDIFLTNAKHNLIAHQ
jgi:hypothetical protein